MKVNSQCHAQSPRRCKKNSEALITCNSIRKTAYNTQSGVFKFSRLATECGKV